MRLLSLYAHNFKKLRLKQPLVFAEGIVLITGLNESGKSTILDAILYALFGRMIRPSQKPGNEEIISYGASDCQVRLVFEIAGNTYRVTREVHKNRPGRAILQEVKAGGTTKNLASTFNDSTAEVERLLGGITYNEIVASSVVAQKDLERLIKQRLDDRRKVINIFLNLESFNKVQDQLESDKNSIMGTTRNPGRLTLEQRELDRLQDQLKQYKEGEAQMAQFEENVKTWKTELASSEARSEKTDGLFKVLDDYDETFERKAALDVEIRDKAKRVEDLNQQLEQFQSNKEQLKQAKEKTTQYRDLQSIGSKLDAAAEKFETIRTLKLATEQLQANIRSQESSIEEKRKEYESAGQTSQPSSELRSHWTYLILTAAFGAGSILSFLIGQELVTVALGSIAVIFLLLHARQIASLSQQASRSKLEQDRVTGLELVKIMEDENSRLKADFEESQKKLSVLSEQSVATLNGVSRYSSLLSKEVTDPELAFDLVHSAYEKDVQKLRDLESKIGLLEEFAKNETLVKERLDLAEKESTEVKEKSADVSLPALPEGIIFSKKLLEKTRLERDNLRDAVMTSRVKIEETMKRQQDVRLFIEENKDIEEKTRLQQSNVALLKKELEVLKYALQGIEQTAESLRNRVKPQVERYMGLILPAITSGRYKAVQLDDDYTVRVFDPDAGEFKPKEVFSGGTEDQMLLAMRLAFALALMPQAKGRNPEFLFLDEPLGSSDKVRRDGILTLLHGELSQNFKQIFLISHVGDLEAEANSIIQMDNGTVQEIVERKQRSQSVVQQVEVPA